MKLAVLFILTQFYCISLIAQVDYTFTLNSISKTNEDVIDIYINNPSDETIYILRTEQSQHVKVKFFAKGIAAHSSVPIRLKLNPRNKGNLSEVISLYFSHVEKPIQIEVKTKVNRLPKNGSQDCPSFGGGGKFVLNTKTGVYEQEDAGEFQKVSLTLETTASLSLVEDSIPQVDSIEQKESFVEEGKQRLSPEERRSQPSLLAKLFGNPTNDTTEITKVEERNPTEKEDETTPFQDSLLGEEYKPNHVIFLIDASTSMNEADKMQLLQETMIKLLNPLRPQDYLSIVTYSGDAQVLLQPTSAIEKEKIKEIILGIKAEGSTQAVKGIKTALALGRSHFIENGNNQIILATDGAFNIGERNMSLRRKIKSNASEGLKISVLGIKNEKWTNKSLKEIVELGEGQLIPCKSKKDTQKVLEAVKKNALF